MVPKARLTAPQAVKTAAPATVKTVAAKVMKPMAKAKAKAARKLGNAKVKKAAVKPKREPVTETVEKTAVEVVAAAMDHKRKKK